jgi:hypothetical protein
MKMMKRILLVAMLSGLASSQAFVDDLWTKMWRSKNGVLLNLSVPTLSAGLGGLVMNSKKEAAKIFIVTQIIWSGFITMGFALDQSGRSKEAEKKRDQFYKSMKVSMSIAGLYILNKIVKEGLDDSEKRALSSLVRQIFMPTIADLICSHSCLAR